MASSPILAAALREYGSNLTANFRTADFNPAQAEDQLKGPTQTLLHQVGLALDLEVEARTEAQSSSLGVRPDIGVSVGHLLTGHVELKAPGKGAQAEKLTDSHDREQWHKLADHPNLVYTDGTEWALYRMGTRVGPVVRACRDVTRAGSKAFSASDAIRLEALLRDFLTWQPLVPRAPAALAELLAPLCRLLRESVLIAMAVDGSALAQLAKEWRQNLFPDADDLQFADAYAQTLTYALLLARFEGEGDIHSRAAERLDLRHGLLAQVLRNLADPQAREAVQVPVALLERVIGAVDPAAIRAESDGGDPWLYFYEDFLAAYDPKLRKNRGVYFTPVEVVRAQVALVTDLLVTNLGKALGTVDDDVVLLDPACGTGTYLLAAFANGVARVRERFGPGAVGPRATLAACNFHGFELLIGPYAVAHLRFAQQTLTAGGKLPDDGVHIYLTDTLDSPHAEPMGQMEIPLVHRKLAEEHARARRVKSDTRVLVCLGNPPYYRQQIDASEVGVEREGGWVRFGDDGAGGILRDFTEPASTAGQGRHLKNLYNLYVYFWRWAIWKVLDTTNGPGIISFITASSYLRGPGFIGMRRKMREVFDDLWIIDLGGEGRAARRSANVFAIQTPVAIAVGIRYGAPDPNHPARVYSTRIEGSEEEKLARLGTVDTLGSLSFEPCFDAWEAPMLPRSSGQFAAWALLTDLFPWQQSGIKVGRTWPIAPDPGVLDRRWRTLLGAPADDRQRFFKDSPTGVKIGDTPKSLPPGTGRPQAVLHLSADAAAPRAVPYAYRSFDRQMLLADSRLLDRPSPSLWTAHGPRQLYLTSLLTGVLGEGPAATVTALMPDLHHFRGSFGGRDVVPLWRDAAATSPNVTAGLLDALSVEYGLQVRAEDLFAYCYALLASPAYVERFREELEVPGPHIPLTSDPEQFDRTVALGRQCIWLHTFGAYRTGGSVWGDLDGSARCITPVPPDAARYPDRYAYDERRQALAVGTGEFAPVSPAIWTFTVSGFPVVRSWLDYRMRQQRSQRTSSPLDAIRVERWPAHFTEELLRLLWVLEGTVELWPELASNLTSVIEGPLLDAGDLPAPSERERRPPAPERPVQGSLGL
ncbi:MAG: N-6 DNA methylase [Actinomycetota bacterium]|nr:N-6 DNA methylase [Actinomycetota bacterium]